MQYEVVLTRGVTDVQTCTVMVEAADPKAARLAAYRLDADTCPWELRCHGPAQDFDVVHVRCPRGTPIHLAAKGTLLNRAIAWLGSRLFLAPARSA
jgi:hypothetical protein